MDEYRILNAYYTLASTLLLRSCARARRGYVEDRVWLMSPDGSAFMERLGLDACAVQTVLLREWCPAELRSILLEQPNRIAQ